MFVRSCKKQVGKRATDSKHGFVYVADPAGSGPDGLPLTSMRKNEAGIHVRIAPESDELLHLRRGRWGTTSSSTGSGENPFRFSISGDCGRAQRG